MRKSLALLKRFAREEDGASMIEYAVLVGLITATLVGVLVAISGNVLERFQDVRDALLGTPTS